MIRRERQGKTMNDRGTGTTGYGVHERDMNKANKAVAARGPEYLQ